jgi:replicative DNA helicase
MALRVLAAESRVGVTRIRTWGMDQGQLADVTEAAGRLASLPFFLDDAPCPKLRDVLARTRALVQRHPSVKLVGVDFVQLLEADEKTDNRARALDVIVKGLKGLAKDLGVAIIILAQPDGKTIEARDDDRQLPELGDLAWSQTIRQLSDLILCGYRPGLAAQRKGPSDTPDRVGYFAWRKNRRGALGSFSLGWHGPTTAFLPIVREEWRAFA